MSHDHHDHASDHAHGPFATLETLGGERRVLIAMLLTAGFTVVEVVGGLVAGSLALLSDAGHMVTDTASLGLAWVAFRVARRPSDASRSYGYHRTPVLAAFVNGVALLALVAWILVEAVQRLLEPQPVMGGVLMAVAAGGWVVNIAAFAVLHGGSHQDLNLRGASLHVLGDLLGSVAALAAGAVILLTGWMPIDPLLSMLVALLILRSAFDLTRRSAHILLEGTPEGVDAERVRHTIVREMDEVDDVHHIHVWALAPGRPLLTLHAEAPGVADHDALLHRILALVEARFGIDHATVQLETGPCPDTPDADKTREEEPDNDRHSACC